MIEVINHPGYTLNGVEYDWLGQVVTTTSGPICGCCQHHHAGVAAIRECHRIAADLEAEMLAEIAVEKAYERHLEDRGYWDARDEEQRWLSMGVYA